MKRTTLVSPGTLSRLRLQVQQAWEDRNLRQCIEHLERVLRLAPADTWALGELGRDFYNPSMAPWYFERALSEKGVTAKILVKAAEVVERNRPMDDAARLLERALQLESNHPPA